MPLQQSTKQKLFFIIRKHKYMGDRNHAKQSKIRLSSGQSIFNQQYYGGYLEQFVVNPNFVNIKELNSDLSAAGVTFKTETRNNYSTSYPGKRRYELLYTLNY